MMRSLYSGVSGLKNHQNRMDVVGNNISNVNTTGFKSSRVTFSDTLSQTLSGASAPQGTLGGINPKQIGLGSSLASIDTVFTDGSVQNTGVNTDLCLSGSGLFVVANGEQKYYTRNGNFKFDKEGNFVNSQGYYVLGYTEKDANGAIIAAGEPNKIVLDPKASMAATKTSTATFASNLDADTTGYTISNITAKYSDGTVKTVTSYDPAIMGNGKVSLTMSTGEVIELGSNAGYSFVTGQNVTGKTLYESTITKITANGANQVGLTLGTGSAIHSINGSTSFSIPASDISSGDFTIGGGYTLSGTISQVTANGANSIDLQVNLNPAVTGVTNPVTINVPKPANFSYSVGDAFSTTLAIDSMSVSAGATVSMADKNPYTLPAGYTTFNVTSTTDKFQRIGTAADGTITTIARVDDPPEVTITATDGSVMSALSGKAYSAGDIFYPDITTTLKIYDTQGSSHVVPVIFTKTSSNTWELSLSGGGKSTTMIDPKTNNRIDILLSSSDLIFDSTGRYVSGSGSLDLSYYDVEGNPTAARQNVALNLAPITQYSGSSTVFGDTDGNEQGTIKSVSVDSSGVITATYTNGITQAEAQVAVAKFSNPEGLTKTSQSLYAASNNSGTAQYGAANALGCTITPSALEMSNVDMASELTDMIVTQRGYQSNSKIITVSDELLETLINMKR